MIEWPESPGRPSRRPRQLPKVEPQPEVEQLPTEFMGIPIKSKNEARVGLMLWALQWTFGYQVPVFGGRLHRGGQVLDFLVYTAPLPTPLSVKGAHWHTGILGRDDPFNDQRVGRVRGWADPREIWDYETQTLAQTRTNLYLMFGRG